MITFNILIVEKQDLIKPSTIKDLRVADLDLNNHLVTLKFTAPGDNADLGTGLQTDLLILINYFKI
jgi:hypothetical protein